MLLISVRFDFGEVIKPDIPFSVLTSRFIESPSILTSSTTTSFFESASATVMSASMRTVLNASALHFSKLGGFEMKKSET